MGGSREVPTGVRTFGRRNFEKSTKTVSVSNPWVDTTLLKSSLCTTLCRISEGEREYFVPRVPRVVWWKSGASCETSVVSVAVVRT